MNEDKTKETHLHPAGTKIGEPSRGSGATTNTPKPDVRPMRSTGKETKMHPPGTHVRSHLEDKEESKMSERLQELTAQTEGKTQEEIDAIVAALSEEELDAISAELDAGEETSGEVSDHARAILAASLAGDPIAFENAVKEAITDRANEAIGAVRAHMAEGLFGDEPEETEDDDDEQGEDTIGDPAPEQPAVGEPEVEGDEGGDEDEVEEETKTETEPQDGDLQELTKRLLGRYIQKADPEKKKVSLGGKATKDRSAGVALARKKNQNAPD